MKTHFGSTNRLVFIINVGAFVYLLEFWVVSLPHFSSLYHVPYWFFDFLWVELWPDQLFDLFDQLLLSLMGALLWILPYRLLSFLRPLKVIPYLWVASVAITAFLLLELVLPVEAVDMSALDRALGQYAMIYLLPTGLFHYYFRRRASKFSRLDKDQVKA